MPWKASTSAGVAMIDLAGQLEEQATRQKRIRAQASRRLWRMVFITVLFLSSLLAASALANDTRAAPTLIDLCQSVF